MRSSKALDREIPQVFTKPAFQCGTAPWSLQILNSKFEQSKALSNDHKCPRAFEKPQITATNCVSRRIFLHNLILLQTLALPMVNSVLASELYFDKYDQYAATYERLDGTNSIANTLGFNTLRKKLIERAKGDTLELGIGTGVNLPLYNFQLVSSVTGLDFSSEMLSLAKQQASQIAHEAPNIRFIQGRAENVNLPDGTFDTILDTFSLCVFPEPVQALQEAKRLLRNSPGARVLLLEHSLSGNPLLAAYQNLIAEPTAAMSKGCYPNQNVTEMVRGLGFRILHEERYLAGTIVYLELGV